MNHILSDKTVDRFVKYGINVFGIKFDGDKFFNQDAGSNPFNHCEEGCPGARPCCRHWTIRSRDMIEDTQYFDMVCDSWEPKWRYMPAGAKKEECVKYEIVETKMGYVNECKEWKYYK